MGTRLFTWGSTPMEQEFRCGSCGAQVHFVHKTAMRFFTIFFIIPVIPISGKMQLIECPRCKSRFQWKGETMAAASK